MASLVALLEDMSSSSLMPVTVAPSPAMFMLVLATIVVPVMAPADAAPIVTPSIVPPLISAVSAISASMLAVPSINRSLNSVPDAPKSISLSVTGTMHRLESVFVQLNCHLHLQKHQHDYLYH